jgi:hypothetical protein
LQDAINATLIILFALAKDYAALHIEQAFQASSPKNFQGPVGNDRPLFYALMIQLESGPL